MNYARFFCCFILFSSFFAIGQSTRTLRPEIRWHATGAIREEMNVYLYSGINLGLRYHFTQRFFTDATTYSPVIKRLDPARNGISTDYGFRSPVYNQTSAVAGFAFLVTHRQGQNSHLSHPDVSTEYYRISKLSARAGYYRFQQSLYDGLENEYWIDKVDDQGNSHYFTGYGRNCVALGLDLYTATAKTSGGKAKGIAVHHFYVDAIYALTIEKSVMVASTDGTYEEGTYVPRADGKDWSLDKHWGVRGGYEYTHAVCDKWAVTVGTDMVCKPIPVYSPLPDFGPRGKVGVPPFTFSVKLGVSFLGSREMNNG